MATYCTYIGEKEEKTTGFFFKSLISIIFFSGIEEFGKITLLLISYDFGGTRFGFNKIIFRASDPMNVGKMPHL